MNPRVWIAYGVKDTQRTPSCATAREAAAAFFAAFPKARKVRILEWEDTGDGMLRRTYSLTFGPDSTGPRSFRDLNKAAALALTV